MNNQIQIPLEIQNALDNHYHVAISISGGKDSQALLFAVVTHLRAIGYPKDLYFAIHADLGRMEWKQTSGFCAQICNDLDVPLITVRRSKEGDLITRIEQRRDTLLAKGENKPFFPSAKARYCTSDMKVVPIDKYLRHYSKVINVMGIRSDESKARSLKPCVETRQNIQTKTRNALNWNPILHWNQSDVWSTYGNTINDLLFCRNWYNQTGLISSLWKFHPVYAMGNDRLSCVLCVLGSLNDLQNGIRHNPEVANHLIDMETQSGFTYQHKRSLQSIKDGLQNKQIELFI